MTLTYGDGQIIGENAVDAVAVATERYPSSRLIRTVTTLTLRDPDGREHDLSTVKERVK